MLVLPSLPAYVSSDLLLHLPGFVLTPKIQSDAYSLKTTPPQQPSSPPSRRGQARSSTELEGYRTAREQGQQYHGGECRVSQK